MLLLREAPMRVTFDIGELTEGSARAGLGGQRVSSGPGAAALAATRSPCAN